MPESKPLEQPMSSKERLQKRAQELYEEMKRYEEIEPKLFPVGAESSLMKKQQELAYKKNKEELEKIKKELKFKFGIELAEE